MTTYFCINCSEKYPPEGLPYTCPKCGGIFTVDLSQVLTRDDFSNNEPGIWRFRHTFGLPDDAPLSYLGEGRTPLLQLDFSGNPVYLKMETHNPTLSFKDRATAILISMLRQRKVHKAVEDSSGNAGASFAAYCSAFGVEAEIFIPESTSGPKRLQIESYNASINQVAGSRQATTDAALLKVRQNRLVYASHAYQPFGLSGIATVAYEIFEQLGAQPDLVIAPVGHGSLLLGLIKGFELLKKSHLVDSLPEFIGVQAEQCAPVSSMWNKAKTFTPYSETIAEGVRVTTPIRGREIITKLQQSSGSIMTIPEPGIIAAWQDLKKKGIFVEPTSALVWAAYRKLSSEIYKFPVLIMTGYGLKSGNA